MRVYSHCLYCVVLEGKFEKRSSTEIRMSLCGVGGCGLGRSVWGIISTAGGWGWWQRENMLADTVGLARALRARVRRRPLRSAHQRRPLPAPRRSPGRRAAAARRHLRRRAQGWRGRDGAEGPLRPLPHRGRPRRRRAGSPCQRRKGRAVHDRGRTPSGHHAGAQRQNGLHKTRSPYNVIAIASIRGCLKIFHRRWRTAYINYRDIRSCFAWPLPPILLPFSFKTGEISGVTGV